MLDAEVERLVERYKFSEQQAATIRSAMANYALAASIDSEVRKEAELVCTEECELFFEEQKNDDS
jgi:Zn-dependent M32 family carboxypeptidase